MKLSESEKSLCVGEQAAAWFARNRASDFSPQDLVDFNAWLSEDKEHSRAYLEIKMLWDILGSFAERPEIKAHIQHTRALRGAN